MAPQLQIVYATLAVGFAVQVAVFLFRGRITRRRISLSYAEHPAMFRRAIACYVAIDLMCWAMLLSVFRPYAF